MKELITRINHLLVGVYDDIEKIEERSLKKGAFHDLSITELHTIEAIGLRASRTMSEIAADLEITMGTLTTAMDRLSRKGYISRIRSSEDRRMVHISLTRKGQLAYRIHEKFHIDMVRGVVEGLTQEEERTLVRALEKLKAYLKKVSIV